MRIFVLGLLLSIAAIAQTMTPHGTYVYGSKYNMAPDGKYVCGTGYKRMPNGMYVGVNCTDEKKSAGYFKPKNAAGIHSWK